LKGLGKKSAIVDIDAHEVAEDEESRLNRLNTRNRQLQSKRNTLEVLTQTVALNNA